MRYIIVIFLFVSVSSCSLNTSKNEDLFTLVKIEGARLNLMLNTSSHQFSNNILRDLIEFCDQECIDFSEIESLVFLRYKKSGYNSIFNNQNWSELSENSFFYINNRRNVIDSLCLDKISVICDGELVMFK